jgi:uncharacterized protein YndB with AHSA1/START domain
MTTVEPLRIEFTVACGIHHAFETWTSRIAAWWPPDHTATGADGVEVILERQVGGRIFERAQDGTEIDWGEVTAWDPPSRLSYLWHLRSRRDDATDVDIQFIEVAERETRVEIVHVGWERLGATGQTWRDRNRAGWSGLIPHFVAAAEA